MRLMRRNLGTVGATVALAAVVGLLAGCSSSPAPAAATTAAATNASAPAAATTAATTAAADEIAPALASLAPDKANLADFIIAVRALGLSDNSTDDELIQAGKQFCELDAQVQVGQEVTMENYAAFTYICPDKLDAFSKAMQGN